MGSGETRRKIGDSKEKDFFKKSILFTINKATPAFFC